MLNVHEIISLEKDVFRHVTRVGMRNRTSKLALSLSHRDSTVSEVYYEVHMTSVLHTARISNVDGVMCINRERSLFGSVVEHRSAESNGWIPHEDLEFFLCPTLETRRKTSF